MPSVRCQRCELDRSCSPNILTVGMLLMPGLRPVSVFEPISAGKSGEASDEKQRLASFVPGVGLMPVILSQDSWQVARCPAFKLDPHPTHPEVRFPNPLATGSWGTWLPIQLTTKLKIFLIHARTASVDLTFYQGSGRSDLPDMETWTPCQYSLRNTTWRNSKVLPVCKELGSLWPYGPLDPRACQDSRGFSQVNFSRLALHLRCSARRGSSFYIFGFFTFRLFTFHLFVYYRIFYDISRLKRNAANTHF